MTIIDKTDIVDQAERELRAAGAGNRASAEVALRQWKRRGELSDAEHVALLGRFDSRRRPDQFGEAMLTLFATGRKQRLSKRYWFELTKEERDAAIVAAGQNPNLPPRGVSGGTPPPGLRNWVCAADGHADPDNSGFCIHCGKRRTT